MEDIEKIDKQIEKLKKQSKAIVKQQSKEERKQRTRKLIQSGALAEKYFNIQHLTLEQKETIFKMFSNYVNENIPKNLRGDADG
ncbi:hypothetical protein HB876_13850 [Listeria seeligeri]|nr:hypothetical protein [Listeria seeligeri]HAB0718283.1 hypothetical protein [Listeria monocytogenes]